ncbi:MAG: T9SS type A sorting domain-containing protein [Flavobacteriales bacterium]|jgi:hypothetical protein
MKTYSVLLSILLFNLTLFANSGFRENIGQIKNQNGQPAQAVRYLLHCDGFNVQLREDGFSYDFYQHIGDSVIINRVDFNFHDYNPNYSIKKELPKNAFTSTFVTDQKNPQFEKIIYQNFYEGIDLIFKRTDNNHFEYDFLVTEKGDINDIHFSINGAEVLETKSTSIKLKTQITLFEEVIPLSFDSHSNPIEVTYQNIKQNTFKFSYKGKAKNITIDPTPQLVYATYSGSQWWMSDVKFLSDMSYAVSGYTQTLTNIATEGSYQNHLLGEVNATLTRFDASNQLMWCTYFGTDQTASTHMIIQDNLILFAGYTNSTILPAEQGFQSTFGGFRDVFVAAFDISGDFLYSSYLGGTENDQPASISKLNDSQFAITGFTFSENFPTLNSSNTYAGDRDAFLAVFDFATGECQYSSVFGGNVEDVINGVVKTQNNKYAFFGRSNSPQLTQSGSLPLPSFLHTQNSNTDTDALFGVLDENFSLEFIGLHGAEGYEAYTHGKLNNEGKIILTNDTRFTEVPYTPNAQNTELNGHTSGLTINIIDQNFNLTYCSLLSPAYIENNSFYITEVRDIHIAPDNSIYLTGDTRDGANIATPDALYPQLFEYPLNTMFGDAYIIKLASNGITSWGTYFGGYCLDGAYGIDLKNDKLIICGGSSGYATFPEEYQYSFVTPDAFQTEINPGGGWIAIFDQLVNVSEFESAENTIHIFPNPTSEMINLKGEELQQALCTIYDLTGKAVYSNQLNTPTINIENLPSGIYTLTLQTPSSLRKAKFVKQ